jgi:hypothetical protein
MLGRIEERKGEGREKERKMGINELRVEGRTKRIKN